MGLQWLLFGGCVAMVVAFVGVCVVAGVFGVYCSLVDRASWVVGVVVF